MKQIKLKIYSMKRFILVSIVSVIFTLMLANAAFIYFDTKEQIDEIFDARLAQSARVMDKLFNAYFDLKLSPNNKTLDWLAKNDSDKNIWHKYEKKLQFQLFDNNGGLLLRSPTARDTPPVPLSPGFRVSILKDFNDDDLHKWRIFVLKSPTENRWFVASERIDVRTELTDEITRRSLLVTVVVLIMIIIAIPIILKKGFEPINDLSKSIHQRSPKNFDPFTPSDSVHELEALYTELNRLLKSQQESFEREKQFTNAAAHELRTPLAILKIHAENALSSTHIDEARISLNKLLSGIDRSARLIQQLLMLARVENLNHLVLDKVNLQEILRETLAALTPLALNKKQTIELNSSSEIIYLESHAILLNTLLSNLIDNAIRYTPAGGTLSVEVNDEATGVHVRIIDSGIGVSDAHLKRLGEPFFRANTGKGDGTGLGLAIVKRICTLLSIQLNFANRTPTGLIVTLYIPRSIKI